MPFGGAENASSTLTRRPAAMSASTSQVLRQAMPRPARHQSCSTWPSLQSSRPLGRRCWIAPSIVNGQPGADEAGIGQIADTHGAVETFAGDIDDAVAEVQ